MGGHQLKAAFIAKVGLVQQLFSILNKNCLIKKSIFILTEYKYAEFWAEFISLPTVC